MFERLGSVSTSDLTTQLPAMTQNRFNCYLIGADTLLLECGDVLLRNGHEVFGVITSEPAVAAWAGARGIEVIDAATDYAARLRGQPFDYLFAITHLGIISDEVLGLPEKGAINFHDGPLPRYAGLNAPVWALLNGEREHGVTWHEMTSDVDGGDILLQARFAIAPDETALSLNTKCMAAALDTFPTLVEGLAADQLTPTPQDLEQRSYFGRYDRPEGATAVDWQTDADAVAKFVRAFTFGGYENPIGLPKAVSTEGAEPFVLTEVSVVGGPVSGETGQAEPGEIVAVSEDGIRVATGAGDVLVPGGRTLEGQHLGAVGLARRYQLGPGVRFESAESPRAEALTAVDARLKRSEPYWTRRLRSAVSPVLPLATGVSGTPDPRTLDIPLPAALDAAADEDVLTVGIAAWAVVLARIGRSETFDLGRRVAAPASSENIAAWYSEVVPVRFELDTTDSFDEARRAVASELAGADAHGTFLRDLLLRQPDLSDDIVLEGPLLPVGFSVGGQAPVGALVWLVFDSGRGATLVWDAARLEESHARALASALEACLAAATEDPSRRWTELPLVDLSTRARILEEFNDTAAEWDDTPCIHELFELRVDATPDATAVVVAGDSLTYGQLEERANRLAHRLRMAGVGPGAIVGVHVSRSMDLLVSTLGVLKAGGAYLPLDPEFPAERLAFMIRDAEVSIIITEALHSVAVDGTGAQLLRIDADAADIRAAGSSRPDSGADPDDLAYVIYTSGSTGTPKGVLVEHRNVTSFFRGMDDVIPHDPPGVWLSVTSLSFDISVLELFWTLARGFTVVVFADEHPEDSGSGVSPDVRARPMEFGLFMWGNDDGPGPQKYRLMLEGARFFDENGFDSVWTPERHFHAFGGPFPNPSVTGAAIAAVTERVAIRSGSCVSPLHHAIRVAEEWAVVDNLSDGRVGLAFAAGWQPNDFILRPESFGRSKQEMIEQIDIVRRLWRGEAVEFESPTGQQVPIVTLPRPVQDELPVWVTTAGNPETYRMAGAMGANVLTHLLGQTLEEVAGKIAIYRDAREKAGLDPAAGTVSLMLHTFVGKDADVVKEIVRQPMKDYLGASMKLVLGFAWTFPAFKRPGGSDATPDDIDLESLSEEEVDTILDFAFERYFETSGLFGTPEMCLRMVERCKAAGADEIACLLDFGVDTGRVLDSLPLLKIVRDESNRSFERPPTTETLSLAGKIQQHGVTHLQCTPSKARLILADSEARNALASVEHLMVGGEALPPPLANELLEVSGATLTNMYGPTETTIWSTTHPVERAADPIPIGRPIANTRVYVLDRYRQPLPPGIPGDLWIGGPGVTRGYHRREELTSERFVQDPFVGCDARMYWTGDLAAHRRDGVIEFFGRSDHQVKIRGYRIELGEIEAALEGLAGVHSAAVIVHEEGPGDQRLVAYTVVDGATFGESELRAHLRDRLPAYMVPGTFVILDRMPLTPNGKIDRGALPVPREVGRGAEAETYEAPANDLETTIARCWEATLGVDRVGVSENFFDIGGHSLLVVQLHRMLTEQLEHAPSLVDLYRFPTIRALTGYLGASDDGEGAAQEGLDRAVRRRKAMGRRRGT